jgi:soluble lytic murein transglycosylase-like protein
MMKKTIQVVIPICIGLLLIIQMQKEIAPLIIPIKVYSPNCNLTLSKLNSVGIKSQLIAESVELAAKRSGISIDFLIALMKTESEGKQYVVSNKGYKGLMQIPHSVFYSDANVLIGAHIFREKLHQAKGDVIKALCLYKGYPVGSNRGKEQADKVMMIYNRLKEEI